MKKPRYSRAFYMTWTGKRIDVVDEHHPLLQFVLFTGVFDCVKLKWWRGPWPLAVRSPSRKHKNSAIFISFLPDKYLIFDNPSTRKTPGSHAWAWGFSNDTTTTRPKVKTCWINPKIIMHSELGLCQVGIFDGIKKLGYCGEIVLTHILKIEMPRLSVES